MLVASADTLEILSRNWARVQRDVAQACEAADRDPANVTIVGVSKYVGAELTVQLAEVGCRVLGENRPQVIWEKFEFFASQADAPQVAWHMIGHFQRNKVRRTLPMLSSLHSLDSLRLAKTVHEEASRAGIELATLVEINVSQDAAKTGLPPAQVPELLTALKDLPAIRVCGLMAMATQFAGGDDTRREFASVRKLRDELAEQFPEHSFHQLSIGMSGDFREAISEGATHVRIGSSLWEGIL